MQGAPQAPYRALSNVSNYFLPPGVFEIDYISSAGLVVKNPHIDFILNRSYAFEPRFLEKIGLSKKNLGINWLSEE